MSATVPTGVDGIDAAWLTDAFRDDATLPDDATVTAVRAERIAQDSGFSSLLYRLYLDGSGVPDTLIAKLPAESEARGAMELLGGYRREVAFYDDVAGHTPLGTPHAYAAAIADESADFVLLLEDLREWDNADHLAGLSMDRARICIGQLAGLHRWSNTSVAQQFPSVDNAMTRDLFLPAFAYGWQLYRERAERSVPADVARFAEHFAERAPEALDALTERDMLLHGDIRADNLFFDGDRMKVVDFQFTARGVGAADIAYLVSQGLDGEVRAGHDEALVREYVGHMTDYPFDEAWRHYRFATAYLVMMPVVALLSWDSVPERSRRLCMTLVDRAVAAIDETDALQVFS